MRFRKRIQRVPLAGALLLGCGPSVIPQAPDDAAERYAESVCGAHAQCDCLGSTFETMVECEAVATSLFDEVADFPEVFFHEDCFEGFLGVYEDTACEPVSSGSAHCSSFTGRLREGDPCPTYWSSSTGLIGIGGPCGGDLTCYAGTCTSRTYTRVPLGEDCDVARYIDCLDPSDNYCAPDGTCRAQVGAGESCDNPRACGERGHSCFGLRPDPVELGVCILRIEEGEACDPEDINPCERIDAWAYCNKDGLCHEGDWPLVCNALGRAPSTYTPSDWWSVD